MRAALPATAIAPSHVDACACSTATSSSSSLLRQGAKPLKDNRIALADYKVERVTGSLGALRLVPSKVRAMLALACSIAVEMDQLGWAT